jgi:tetratricopeptide (TPR) repeat protein
LFFLALEGPRGPGRRAALEPEALGLELAACLAQIGQVDRAEAVLRRVLEQAPGAAEALAALSDLLLGKGALDEADEALALRVDAEEDPSALAEVILERARRRAAAPGGEVHALALLRRLPIDALTAEGLTERARLAERVGDARDALACLRRGWELAVARGDEDGAASLAERLLVVAPTPGIDDATAIEALEALAARAPGEPRLLEARFGVYARLEDERIRNRAWASLLEHEEALQPLTRARIHLALAEAAERDGDLARAEVSFRGALALDTEPPLRARALVGHARILIAWRQVEDAQADLGEALALMPDHAGALLALGELAYRNQDWEVARSRFAALAAAPGWQDVISTELLAFRRAELAEVFGDEAEAEAAYREVARLDPRRIEAREALAEIALYRQDSVEAARHLEDLLTLYPAEAVDKQREVRERLGAVRHQLGDDADARYHLELVLAEEPERVSVLEGLAVVYQALGLHRQAADLLGRLGRAHPEARGRAEALFRQGELLGGTLGDPAAAGDAYLRSSDQDPTFVPTLRRLAAHFFEQGDWQNLGDVGRELERLSEGPGEAIGVRLSLGALAGTGDAVSARRYWPRVLHVEVVVEALLALGQRPGVDSRGVLTEVGRLLRVVNGDEIAEQVVEVLRQLRDAGGSEQPRDEDRAVIEFVLAALAPPADVEA